MDTADQPEPDQPAPARQRLPRLRSEFLRVTLGMVLAIAIAAVGFVIIGGAARSSGMITLEALTSPASIAVLYLGFWIIYCIIYIATTLAAFGRADGATLQAWFTESQTRRRQRRVLELMALTSGPAGAISLCVTALLVVVAFSRSDELRGNPLVIFLTFLVVASSWFIIAISYAQHYARENSYERGFGFPGEEVEGPPTFADYLYLAVQIGTTFATSDVVVERRSMRRTVTAHSIAAFAYNTVVIALIVSLFLTST